MIIVVGEAGTASFTAVCVIFLGDFCETLDLFQNLVLRHTLFRNRKNAVALSLVGEFLVAVAGHFSELFVDFSLNQWNDLCCSENLGLDLSEFEIPKCCHESADNLESKYRKQGKEDDLQGLKIH